jgi:four helix bundle suffix protein
LRGRLSRARNDCEVDSVKDRSYRTHGTHGTYLRARQKLSAMRSRAATSSLKMQPHEPLLPQHGNYRALLSFQKAEVVFDITHHFCNRFLASRDRTIDQMIQAARSGKQNIIEGSKASVTSKETELKLTNVARASFEELLEDYRDYLRVRSHRIWEKESREAAYVRDLGRQKPQTYEIYRPFCETRPAETVANIAHCLIHQTNYLLDQQIRRLQEDFLKYGGIRERMTAARLRHRQARPQQ